MKTNKIIYLLILIAILIRIPLLFFNPISMWADPVFRFIPNTYNILEGDFSFYTPPLLMILSTLPTIFLQGFLLELSWKIIPFLFFILSCFVFIKILKIIELGKTEKIFLLNLFLFSVYSLLMSTTIMLEMPVLFFTLCLFYILEKNEKIDLKLFVIIVLVSALLLYSKQTGYFVLAGFFLYIFFKKIDKKQKKLILMALILGFLLNVPWIIKNNIIYGGFFNAELLETQGKRVIDFGVNFPTLISNSFHYIYRIPLLSKLNYSGIFFLLSRIYYFAFLVTSILLTSTIFVGIFKFGLKYKKYLLMILPVFLFSCWWVFLSPMHCYNDFGRFMFSFYFLFFFFGLKFTENLKNLNIKRFFYLIIILFCILSIVTSFAASLEFNQKDKAIREVANILTSKEGIFVANDMFTSTALTYYSEKKIKFLLKENKIDENIKCENNLIYSSDNYLISKNNSAYQICKI